jgi:cytochrome c oxidase cbb3-type subunit 1
MASLSSMPSTAGFPAVKSARDGTDGGPIDESAQGPVVAFVLSSILWLMLGSLLGLIASFKLHTPSFFGGIEFLTYGRVHGAKSVALNYGWGFNAAFAVGIWLMARLSGARIGKPTLLVIACVFWNLGVALGIVGVLAGHGTSLEAIEMPPYVGPILFGSSVFIAMWGILIFRSRTSPHVYISQWYLLAAMLWFPWMFSIAQIMLFVDPARGTVQSLVHAWYSHGLTLLWFTPIGLAAIYYLLPKLLVKPVANYYLCVYGFWPLAIFGGWTGTAALAGGPVPAWVVSAGIAASLLLAVPIVVWAVNFFPTMASAARTLRRDWSYRFVSLGALCLVLGSASALILSLRGVSEVTQFTLIQDAQVQLMSYGFFSMVVFGAIYYILPRVTDRTWHLPGLIGFHFWSSFIGCLASVAILGIAGYNQARALNVVPAGADAIPMALLDIGRTLQPYFFAQTLALLILIGGHLVFAVNVVWLLIDRNQRSTGTANNSLRTPLEAAAR